MSELVIVRLCKYRDLAPQATPRNWFRETGDECGMVMIECVGGGAWFCPKHDRLKGWKPE